MNEIGTKYELGFMTIPLSDLTIMDPGTLKYSNPDELSEDEYYPLSVYAQKQIADILELPSKKFSMDLYEIDIEIWKDLIRKKLISNNVKNSISNKNCLVVNEEILNFYNGLPHISDVLNLMNEYIGCKDLTNYTNYGVNNNEIVLISIDENKVGTLIKYYFEDNYIVVYDCYYDRMNQILILAPYYVVDAVVGEDTYQIANKEVCYAASSVTMPSSIESYLNELKQTFLSADEVITYFKKYLKIKLKLDPLDPFMYGAENDYSNPSINYLKRIIDFLYNDPEFIARINTNYIKRTIYITQVSYYDMMQLFTSRIGDGALDINDLRDLEFNCFKHKNHYCYLMN